MKFNRIAAVCLLALLCSFAVWAAQTPIASQTPKGPYVAGITASSLDLTMTAADASAGNSFTLTGHEVLIMQNTDAGAPHTVTISSVADQYGRTADVTAYSIASTQISAFSFLGGGVGWQQTDGTVHFLASDATVKFAVLYVAR